MRMRNSRAAAFRSGVCLTAVCILTGVGLLTAACSGSPASGATAAGTRASTSGPAGKTGSAGRAGSHLTATGGAIATPDSGAPRVTYSRVRTADGSVITVAVFHGDLRFVLHNGSQDPGHAAASGPGAATWG